MNIKSGMYRLSLVLAVISVIPSFMFGGEHIYRKFTVVNPEWNEYISNPKVWIEKEELRIEKAEKRLEDLKNMNEPIDTQTLLDSLPDKSTPKKYQYPPSWYGFAGGTFFSILSFSIIFFGIRWITNIYLWILQGFKEEEKQD